MALLSPGVSDVGIDPSCEKMPLSSAELPAHGASADDVAPDCCCCCWDCCCCCCVCPYDWFCAVVVFFCCVVPPIRVSFPIRSLSVDSSAAGAATPRAP